MLNHLLIFNLLTSFNIKSVSCIHYIVGSYLFNLVWQHLPFAELFKQDIKQEFINIVGFAAVNFYWIPYWNLPHECWISLHPLNYLLYLFHNISKLLRESLAVEAFFLSFVWAVSNLELIIFSYWIKIFWWSFLMTPLVLGFLVLRWRKHWSRSRESASVSPALSHAAAFPFLASVIIPCHINVGHCLAESFRRTDEKLFLWLCSTLSCCDPWESRLLPRFPFPARPGIWTPGQ